MTMAQPPDSQPKDTKLRVLLVEDSEHDMKAFKRAFDRSDTELDLTHCMRAEEALEMLKAGFPEFDALMVDNNLPGMSGMDLFNQLSSLQLKAPFVLLTGNGSEEVAIDALKSGVDDYIIKDTNGGYLKLLPAVTQDICGKYNEKVKRRRAEEALSESEERFRLALRNSSITVFNQDRELRYTWVYNPNPGLSLSSVLGKTDEDLVPPEEATALTAIKRRVIESGVEERTVINFTVKGETSIYDLEIMPKINDSGLITGIVGVSTDITELKRTEEELRKAQKLESLGVLAGGIAHDFNNLLQGIYGNVSLARMVAGKNSRISKMLMSSEDTLSRAKKLSQQLLTFAKGGAPLKKTLSLSKFIHDSVRFALSGSNVKAEFSLPDGLWGLMADEGQLSQVMQNIIINAAEAMPEGGTVRISVKNAAPGAMDNLQLKEGRYVVINIQDEGVGISEAHLSKIFDPYYSTKKKGSGLGLATSWSIIARHGGSITAESKIDHGTSFTIHLPATEKPAAEERLDDEGPMTGTGRVLVMDDEEIVRVTCQEVLTVLGYDADVSSYGEEALGMYAKAMEAGDPYDAVILDLTVPGGMGGEETMRRLLEMDPDVKAIVASGYANDPVMADHRKYGFVTALSKPYNVEEMGAILYDIINGNLS